MKEMAVEFYSQCGVDARVHDHEDRLQEQIGLGGPVLTSSLGFVNSNKTNAYFTT